MINIEGLNKADVLAALYNGSRPQGMGFVNYKSTPMSREDAELILSQTPSKYFDYLKGRVMKLSLASDTEFDEWGYDRDNGDGAAGAIIAALRTSAAVDNVITQASHTIGKAAAADAVMSSIDKSTTVNTDSAIPVLTMGFSDVADILIPAIDSALSSDPSSPASDPISDPIPDATGDSSSFSGGSDGGAGGGSDF